MDAFAILRGGISFDPRKLQKEKAALLGKDEAAPKKDQSLALDFFGQQQRKLQQQQALKDNKAKKHKDQQQQQQKEKNAQESSKKGKEEEKKKKPQGKKEQEKRKRAQEDEGDEDSASSQGSEDEAEIQLFSKKAAKGKAAAKPEEEDEENEEDGEEEGEDGAGASSDGQDGVKSFRKKNRIYIKGNDAPAPVRSFEDLSQFGASDKLIQKLLTIYENPSPIQMQAIPIMHANRELLGIAPTGSGKTMAFVLPLILALKAPSNKGFRAAIVAPTRELAVQIHREVEKITIAPQIQSRVLDKSTSSKNSFGRDSSGKFDLLISTPMRLVHALQNEMVYLDNVEWLVLDEADRMFENGFEHQIDEIIHACTHAHRRIALFSATMPQRVEELAQTVLHDYIRVTIGAPNAAATTVDQKLVFVGREDGKQVAIRQLIQTGLTPPVLIFVQSKERAQQLFHELVYEGINVDVIHADRTKQQRDTVVNAFREGKVWVLICTDLMARGVDFKAVNMVISYDFPPSAVDYIHRVGRTGRAGRTGTAITFFTEKDAPMLRSIANVVKASGCDVPEWILSLRKPATKKRARTIERDPIASSAKVQEKSLKKKAERRNKAATAKSDA